jgi:hypothetical protein
MKVMRAWSGASATGMARGHASATMPGQLSRIAGFADGGAVCASAVAVKPRPARAAKLRPNA